MSDVIENIKKRFHDIYFDEKSGMFASIAVCINQENIIAGLILIYSTVDSLAFLDTTRKKTKATRSDFTNWIDIYLNLQKLKLTSLELYAARCGIVHAYAAESDLYRQNKARMVFYAWGNKKPIPHISHDWVMIHVNDLASELLNGTHSFLAAIVANPQKVNIVQSKLQKVFANLRVP